MLGNRTIAISAKKSGNADKRKDILDPLNWRYNRGKCRVLNYSMWSARGQDQLVHHVNQITTKQMSRLLKRKQVNNAFLGFVRMVKEENVAEKYKGKSDLGAVYSWREDLPIEIKAVLNDYEDVFPKDLPPGLPPIRKGQEFKIELEDDAPPVHRPLYKLSPLELAEAKKQIEYMLEHGFIRPSDSPYGAPVLFALKKDGRLRFCIDYWWLNKKTVKNRYPLPLPEEMFDWLGNAKVFSKIDLKSGYWQIPVRPGDVHKIAFKMRWGLYKYQVMPFGLTNAPAQFMSMMNDLLGDYLDRFVLIFLDDILIYSANIQEHGEHLRKVLQVLREQQLYAKASKCEIYKHSVEFLGQQICGGGMTPTEAKLKAVRDRGGQTFPKSTEIRNFVAFRAYFSVFFRPCFPWWQNRFPSSFSNVPADWEANSG